MIKNPKYKPIEMNSVKDRNKYLKTLNEQVNKSRMAVETITSFRNTQMKFKKKIDQTQQQLYSTVLRINNQTKKNVVLNELITLMKGQMFNFQKTQKRQQQKNEQQAEKSVKKIHYDIEQILQKHNEEIAKITSLKQAANCGRSERVVFSNLFKKLEKQIKQTEELYKENLLKSEVARDIETPIKVSGRLADKQRTEIKPQSKHSETNMDSFQFESTYSPNDGLFLTQQKYGSAQSESKAIDKSVNLYKQLSASELIEPNNTTRSSGDKIQFYQSFLQKIKIHIGCSDISKAIEYFQKIDHSNLTLLSQINAFNDQIELYLHQMQQISTHKRQSQCYENSKQLPLNSCRRIRILTTQKSQQKQIQEGELQSVVGDLLNMFGQQGMGEDVLKDFDHRLDLLIEATKDDDHPHHQDIYRATTANSEAAAVDILLDKMERFSQCEKLLDKNLFKQQYIKQISKNKKHKNKK